MPAPGLPGAIAGPPIMALAGAVVVVVVVSAKVGTLTNSVKAALVISRNFFMTYSLVGKALLNFHF
jgi:hypothetical protein